MNPTVRSAAFALFFFVSITALRAQEQEHKLSDRLLRPDMTLGNAAQNKSFYGGKEFKGAGNAYVKDFYMPQRFTLREFSTKPFYGVQNHWAGDFKFSTSSANPTTSTVIPNASKNYDTKSMTVKEAYDSGKNFKTGDYKN